MLLSFLSYGLASDYPPRHSLHRLVEGQEFNGMLSVANPRPVRAHRNQFAENISITVSFDIPTGAR